MPRHRRTLEHPPSGRSLLSNTIEVLIEQGHSSDSAQGSLCFGQRTFGHCSAVNGFIPTLPARLMALIHRIFCMMVLAMFSYNAGHSGRVFWSFTQKN
jgi:hypothetical protein